MNKFDRIYNKLFQNLIQESLSDYKWILQYTYC